MSQSISTHTFDNGLTLVIEVMEGVGSAAFSYLVPAGSIHDAPGSNGTAAILCDLITRGAGDRDSRQLSTDLDNLGLHREEAVGAAHLVLSGATVADRLPTALALYADMLRAPHLPPDQFPAARSGIEQSLRALEDEPRQKVIVELRRRCYNAPWGLPTEGSLDDLDTITAELVRDHHDRCVRPNGTIIGIAGNVDAEEIRRTIEATLGDWSPRPEPGITTGDRGPARDHITHDSKQTHIGIAYDAVPYRHDDYYAAWAAVGVLSGGMSSRLFTQVRERRGLCYAVHAVLNSLPDEGRVLCYAGATAERAQETLDVTLAELVRLGDGIEPAELNRCQARAKSALIMQQESTIPRSGAIARDWFHLGRVTTLDEVRGKIEALSVETVLDYVHRHPAGDFTVLTIGPEPLEIAGDLP